VREFSEDLARIAGRRMKVRFWRAAKTNGPAAWAPQTVSASVLILVSKRRPRGSLYKKMNPNAALHASHCQRIDMKITLFSYLFSLAVALTAYGQTPMPPPVSPVTATPFAPPAASVAAVISSPILAATVAPAITAAPTAIAAPSVSPNTGTDDDEDIDNAIEKKIRKHFNFTFDHDKDGADSDSSWIALPIVFIVFLAIFGTPVMIVAVILYFSFSKNRALHKTVRMMVEKGQPVPEALLNPTAPALRNPSDARRGIIWTMVGLGVMIFFGAVNDWEGGAWSLGIIPFLIGLGYLLVWKLDVRKKEASPRV
jgi:hypothetical protein